MQHYFGAISGKEVILGEDEIHHLKDVKRIEIGENIEVSTSNGTFLCIVKSVHPLHIETVKLIEIKRELDNELMLGFSLLKGDHNELITLKGTELGVSTFMPFTSARCQIKPEGRTDRKLERLRKIAKEGAEQCRREIIPLVNDYLSFKEILSVQADLKLIAYEDVAIDGVPLLKELNNLKKGQSVLILIGPEGGFSEAEAKMAFDNGFKFISLGKRILRGETAAIYSCSLISAISEGI